MVGDRARSKGEDTGGMPAQCGCQSSPTVGLFQLFPQMRRVRHLLGTAATPASL